MAQQPAGLHNYGMTCYLNATLQAIKCLLNFDEPTEANTTTTTTTSATRDHPAKRLLKSFLMEGGSGEPFLRHLAQRSENDPHMASSALKFLTLLVNTLVDEGSSSVVERFLIHNMLETLSCPSACHQASSPLKFSEAIPKFHVLITVAGSSLQESVDKSLSTQSHSTCIHCHKHLLSELEMELGEGFILACSDPSRIRLYPDSYNLRVFNLNYNLKSIVGHAGFHYTSLCYTNSQWYFFSDENLSTDTYTDLNVYCDNWTPVLLVYVRGTFLPPDDQPVISHHDNPPSLSNETSCSAFLDDGAFTGPEQVTCSTCEFPTAAWYACLNCQCTICPSCEDRGRKGLKGHKNHIIERCGVENSVRHIYRCRSCKKFIAKEEELFPSNGYVYHMECAKRCGIACWLCKKKVPKERQPRFSLPCKGHRTFCSSECHAKVKRLQSNKNGD
ncbi:hypothetical protein Pelo_6039 [Pelomyxa schiedti]|nr:hypothetical protein Pelo_6039 [Pelomyxa schiedti]